MSASYLVERLTLESRVLSKLPIDSVRGHAVRQVRGACFSHVTPTPLPGVKLVAYSPSCLKLIGLDAAELPAAADQYASKFAGNTLFVGSTPAAHCYCGHQFGSFAGQLGDGAAILLGDVPAAVPFFDGSSSAEHGEATRVELQLKGAGPTPYSRSADGRKVFRSSLREFLCSEFMFGLGIPTTRAATLVTSTGTVERDPLYTGNVVNEKCTVVCRVAPSFVRFGSFEICKPEDDSNDRAGPSAGDLTPLLALYDYVCNDLYRHLPAVREAQAISNRADQRRATCVPLLTEIVRRTARLVAQWQSVGFTHGVLNTDNMSILGLTIDYGPYGFQHFFDEDFVPNQSDDSGRYRYRFQPDVCKWNCHRLADAWSLVFPEKEAEFRAAIDTEYPKAYRAKWLELMRAKLGLVDAAAVSDDVVDRIANSIFAAMNATHADMTHVFLALLSYEPPSVRASRAAVKEASAEDVASSIRPDEAFQQDVVSAIASRCASLDQARGMLSKKLRSNRSMMPPEQVAGLLRLHDEQPQAFAQVFPGAPPAALYDHLIKERDKQTRFATLKAQFDALRTMTTEERSAQNQAVWKDALKEYFTLVSAMHYRAASERWAAMEGANPKFVLLQWVAQAAIAAVEGPMSAGSSSGGAGGPWGNEAGFQKIQRLTERLLKPFEPSDLEATGGPFAAPPEGFENICVSCSS